MSASETKHTTKQSAASGRNGRHQAAAGTVERSLEIVRHPSPVWGPSLKALVLMHLADPEQTVRTQGDLLAALEAQVPAEQGPKGSSGERCLLRLALDELEAEGRLTRQGKGDAAVLRLVAPPADPRFEIVPLFRDLLPRPSPGQERGLECDLVTKGCRNPLLVWKHAGHTCLVDGYRRLAICLRHGLPYQLEEIELPDRAAVVDWTWKHHYDRRSLSAAAQSYVRGRHFNAVKASHGGDRRSGRSSGHDVHLIQTARDVAASFKVVRRTLSRDGKFAAALDAIAAACGPELRTAVLGGSVRLGPGATRRLAALEEAALKQQVAALLAGADAPPRPVARRKGLVVPVGSPATRAQALLDGMGPEELKKVLDAARVLLERARQCGNRARSAE